MNQWTELPPYRLLVTGSRIWTDVPMVGRALWAAAGFLRSHSTYGNYDYRPITLVHGAAVGADLMASAAAVSFGWILEPHPYSEQRHHGNPQMRNAEMVMSGADLCVAFYLPPKGRRGDTRGRTRDCFEKAMDFGIPTWVIQ